MIKYNRLNPRWIIYSWLRLWHEGVPNCCRMAYLTDTGHQMTHKDLPYDDIGKSTYTQYYRCQECHDNKYIVKLHHCALGEHKGWRRFLYIFSAFSFLRMRCVDDYDKAHRIWMNGKEVSREFLRGLE